MRLILDTNVLLSALLSPLGAPAKLLDARERKMFTLVTSDVLIEELRDVAARPFSVRDFVQARPSCSRQDFGTSHFTAATCPPARSHRIRRTVTCSQWLKPARPSSS